MKISFKGTPARCRRMYLATKVDILILEKGKRNLREREKSPWDDIVYKIFLEGVSTDQHSKPRLEEKGNQKVRLANRSNLREDHLLWPVSPGMNQHAIGNVLNLHQVVLRWEAEVSDQQGATVGLVEQQPAAG